jgi:hypothetical protein
MQQAFPLVERAIASARSTLPPPDAELRVGLLAAAAFGWQALSPLLLDAVGHPDLDGPAVADALRPALLAFLRAAPPT